MWEETLKEDVTPVSKYLQLIAPKKAFRFLIDSEYTEGNNHKDVEKLKVTDDMIERWEKLDNDYEYIEREQDYNNLVRIKEPLTLLEQNTKGCGVK